MPSNQYKHHPEEHRIQERLDNILMIYDLNLKSVLEIGSSESILDRPVYLVEAIYYHRNSLKPSLSVRPGGVPPKNI